MSYRHLISVIDHNSGPDPIDFILVCDDFEAVETLAIKAAKSFMGGISHPIIYLRGVSDDGELALIQRTWVSSDARNAWIDTYADQHAKIEIPVDCDQCRRFEVSVVNASGHTVFYKEINVSLDAPVFKKAA